MFRCLERSDVQVSRRVMLEEVGFHGVASIVPTLSRV